SGWPGFWEVNKSPNRRAKRIMTMRVVLRPLTLGLLFLAAGCLTLPGGLRNVSVGPAADARVRKQQAILAVQRKGGIITTQPGDPNLSVVGADLHRIRVTPALLDALGPWNLARTLNLYHTGINDVGLQCFRGLPNVVELNLSANSITDAGLACVQTLA